MHVVQDYQNGKPSPRTFGTVTLMKVEYADAHRLIATCSLCHTAPRLRMYLKADYSSQPSPTFEKSLFMGCQHTQYVTTSVFSQMMADYDTSPASIEKTILSAMKETNEIKEGWLEIPDEIPSPGNFAVYVAEDWEVQVLKVFVVIHYRYSAIEQRKLDINV